MSDGREQAPEAALERARALFGRRTAGELALLMYDSLVDGHDDPANHRLEFEHRTMHIEVHVSAVGTTRLTGTVQPPRPLEIRLEPEGSEPSPPVDAPDGTFSFEPVEPGVVRLHLSGPAGTAPVHTDWFRV